MVVTRRGGRVSPTTKANPVEAPEVQATPSTGRRTRAAAKQAHPSSPAHHVLVETCEHEEDGAPGSPSTATRRRCNRAFRLHSPEQPCTPVGSICEGDISAVEPCCSAGSNVEQPLTRTRSRRTRPPPLIQEDEVSEVESCSSALSTSKQSPSSRRSTRRKLLPDTADVAPAEAAEVKEDPLPETESCSSVVSESQRVTRSQRKTAHTRSVAKRPSEDSELSDADSCASTTSGADASQSSIRRSARSRRQICPIPIRLDESADRSSSPAPVSRRTRTPRGKAPATADLSEPPSCDSEGFESGPSVATRRSLRARRTVKVLDSDSDVTDVHSSRWTPCSSRTGSGSSSSSRTAPTTGSSVSVVLEKAVESAEEDGSMNESMLESTVIVKDEECTLLEEDESQTPEGQEGVIATDLTPSDADTEKVETTVISGNSHESDSPGCTTEAVIEPAVMSPDQQEEPHAEDEAEDSSEMEVMQETLPSEEPSQLSASVTVTPCVTGGAEEADVEVHPAQAVQPDEEAAAVDIRPRAEEMEVSTVTGDELQVEELQVESVQETSGQQVEVAAEVESEKLPEHTQRIVIVYSSDDEEDDDDDDDDDEDEEEKEEEREVSEEEEEEQRREPSESFDAASASIDGLFMIDKRPGSEADEQYYNVERREKEDATRKRAQQAEEGEEFVDEEGDDEDDEDADVLFSSRDPHLESLSSRIDPGISVKQLGGLYISFDGSKSKPVSSSLQKLKEKKLYDEVMKKSVIGPDFEKKDAVPPYSESKQALKLKRREERAKSTGGSWFDMKAPEVTQELKGDLKVLKMRGSLDPKRFYKKNDRDGFPKFFQVGTVVDSPVDFYHSRIPKKERKRTMVDELLVDAEFRLKNKKKYQNVMAEQAALATGKRYRRRKSHRK